MAQAEVIFQESFESEPSADTYTVVGGFDDGASDYSKRDDGSEANYSPHPSNPDGFWYWITEDNNATENTPPGETRITFTNVSVSAFSNLNVVLSLQDAGVDFESSDFIEIYMSTNGAASNLLARVAGEAPNIDSISDDTNLDGVGDGQTTTSDFTDFTWAVTNIDVAQITSVAVTLRFIMSSGGEQFAIDNFRITGDGAPAMPEIFNLSNRFRKQILGVPFSYD